MTKIRKRKSGHICENCGQPFLSSRRDAKTCKPACRVALKKKRDNEKKFTPAALSGYQREWLAWLETCAPDAATTVHAVIRASGAVKGAVILNVVASAVGKALENQQICAETPVQMTQMEIFG